MKRWRDEEIEISGEEERIQRSRLRSVEGERVEDLAANGMIGDERFGRELKACNGGRIALFEPILDRLLFVCVSVCGHNGLLHDLERDRAEEGVWNFLGLICFV